jgi:hypothetical protein
MLKPLSHILNLKTSVIKSIIIKEAVDISS